MQVFTPTAQAATDTARPLHWHNDDALRRIASALDEAQQPWAERWLPAAPVVRAENAPASPHRPADEIEDPNRALLDWVYQALFEEPLVLSGDDVGIPQRPSIALAVARSAAGEWAHGLDAKIGQLAWRVQPPDQGADDALPWAGDAVVHVTLPHVEAPSLRIVISCAAINEHLGPKPAARPHKLREPLADVIDSVAKQTIAAQVFLQPVEVSVGSLLSLKPGDTLVTSHKLTEPVRVTRIGADDQGDPTLCHAHLGRRGARRAVVLMPRAA
jgi:hypothetical protein